MNKTGKGKLLMVLLLFGMIILCSCSEEKDSEGQEYGAVSFEEGLEQLNGQPMGVLSGSIFDALTAEKLPDSEALYFNNISDTVMALEQGKIVGFMTDEPVARMILSENPDFEIMPGEVMDDQYGYAFQKNAAGENLRDEFNEYLEVLKADGTLQEIIDAWMREDADTIELEDISKLPAVNGVLRLGTSGIAPPFIYHREDTYVGIDIDLLTRYCKAKGYALEISIVSSDALIPSLVSGRIDLIADCLSITEERKKSISFSEPTYDGGVVIVTQGANAPNEEKGSLWDSLKSSFEKNFVRENRWKLLLNGLGVTLLISVCSLIVGTIAGFGICMLRRTSNRILSGIAKIYIRLLQGTPIVVLLMIFYYIIFNKSGLDGAVVAVIAFGMNYSAYVAEILRSGIDAVDQGQVEAAAAIGFTKTQTFWKIVFPQAAVHFLPVMKGEFISLVKMTSVVGYVAVQDLTKASDIIRSRTYEAFFPLFMIAVLYFLLSWGLSLLLGLLDVRIDPKRRKMKLPEKREELL